MLCEPRAANCDRELEARPSGQPPSSSYPPLRAQERRKDDHQGESIAQGGSSVRLPLSTARAGTVRAARGRRSLTATPPVDAATRRSAASPVLDRTVCVSGPVFDDYHFVNARAGRCADLQIVPACRRRIEVTFENAQLGGWPQANGVLAAIRADQSRANGGDANSARGLVELGSSDARANRHVLPWTRYARTDVRPPAAPGAASAASAIRALQNRPNPSSGAARKRHASIAPGEEDAASAVGPLEHDGTFALFPIALSVVKVREHLTPRHARAVNHELRRAQRSAGNRSQLHGILDEDFVELWGGNQRPDSDPTVAGREAAPLPLPSAARTLEAPRSPKRATLRALR